MRAGLPEPRRLAGPAAWGGVLALAGLAAANADPQATIDTTYFLHASQTLLSGDWARTFADPGLQAGPLQVGGIGGAARLGEALGASPLRGVAVVQSLVLTAALLGGARALCGPRRLLAAAAAATVALAVSAVGNAYFYGHPAELLVPVLWVVAARTAQERRPALAGALVGLSAGFETWGILGVAVLLLGRRARPALLGAVAAAVVAGALYAPFVLAGPFEMLHYRWTVSPGTLPALLGLGPAFGWPLRLLQGAVAIAAGAVLAPFVGSHRSACWLVPLAVVWARVALDPVHAGWYLLAPETLALLGAAQLAAAWRRPRADAAAHPLASLAETLKPSPSRADS